MELQLTFSLTSSLHAITALLSSGIKTVGRTAIPQPEPTHNRNPGEGVARAQARLRAKLKANEAIPSGERYTRQQDRAEQRRHAKSMRTLRKNRAMQASYPGGAAEEWELFL